MYSIHVNVCVHKCDDKLKCIQYVDCMICLALIICTVYMCMCEYIQVRVVIKCIQYHGLHDLIGLVSATLVSVMYVRRTADGFLDRLQ